MEEGEMPYGAPESFEPLFLNFLFFQPLPDIEPQSSVTAAKEHVRGRGGCAGVLRQYIWYVGEGGEEVAFGGEVVCAVGFECFIVFEEVDEDEGGGDEDEFVGGEVADVQDGFVQGFFSLDYLVLCGAVVDAEAETHGLVVVYALLVAVVVVVAHADVVLEHFEGYDALVAQLALPVGREVFLVDFEALAGVDAVVVRGALYAHQFLLEAALDLFQREPLHRFVPQLHLPDADGLLCNQVQHCPEAAFHSEEAEYLGGGA
jgi:hypothetical protein